MSPMLPPSPTIHPYSQEAATLIQLYKATKLGCFFQMGYNGLSIQLDHAHLQQELPVVLLQSPDYDLLGQHALWYPAQTSMEYNQLKVFNHFTLVLIRHLNYPSNSGHPGLP